MISLGIPFLPDSQISQEADLFRRENELVSTPIEIELAIESRMGMDIVPLPGLQTTFDIEGFSTLDFTSIYVDEFVYSQRYYRYRFTLAHEIGHKVLHEKYLSQLQYSSVDEWCDVVNQIDPSDHSKMEYQANTFAGLVLVPKNELLIEFERELQALRPIIDQAIDNGLSRDDYADTVLDRLAYELSPRFEVSTGVLSRRISHDKLDELL